MNLQPWKRPHAAGQMRILLVISYPDADGPGTRNQKKWGGRKEAHKNLDNALQIIYQETSTMMTLSDRVNLFISAQDCGAMNVKSPDILFF